jgi:toxin ParE1/3/4
VTKKLYWTRRAQTDLVALGRFVAKDNPDAARRLLETLLLRAGAAASMPRSGRRVPELGRDDVREIVVGNYRMAYRLRGRGIGILRVFESHRSFPGI